MGSGLRLAHSIASASDLAWISQKPAISSLVSVKGPSITVRFPPENLTRAPFALGCSPSAASITPAFIISSLNFTIASMSSLVGGTLASLSLVALTSSMNRIVVSPSGCGLGGGLPDGFDRLSPASTQTSNEGGRDRHGRPREV